MKKVYKFYFTAMMVSILAIEGTTLVLKYSFNWFDEPIWRISHLVQMVLLWFSVFIMKRKAQQANELDSFSLKTINLVLVALFFSFWGDLINSFLFDLRFIIDPQTLFSIAPFTVMHVCYIMIFNRLSKQNPDAKVNAFKKRTLYVWPFLSVSLWYVLVDPARPIITYLSFAYAFLVTLMAISSLWVYKSYGRKGLLVSLGGLVFLSSDMTFGYFLLDGPNRPFYGSQLIWVTYLIAQLLISYAPVVAKEKATSY